MEGCIHTQLHKHLRMTGSFCISTGYGPRSPQALHREDTSKVKPLRTIATAHQEDMDHMDVEDTSWPKGCLDSSIHFWAFLGQFSCFSCRPTHLLADPLTSPCPPAPPAAFSFARAPCRWKPPRAAALGSPIVSEFYYQKAKQMIEARLTHAAFSVCSCLQSACSCRSQTPNQSGRSSRLEERHRI